MPASNGGALALEINVGPELTKSPERLSAQGFLLYPVTHDQGLTRALVTESACKADISLPYA